MSTTHLTDPEQKILNLIAVHDGRYGVYRFIGKFRKHFPKDSPYEVLPSLAGKGMLQGLDAGSTSKEFGEVKLTLSDAAKEQLAGENANK